MKVIIVGAGLTCAKVVGWDRRAVRTDEKDGFLLDRGFQVYFTACPVAKRLER